MFLVCVAGVVASQIVMIALYDAADPSRAYYATPAASEHDPHRLRARRAHGRAARPRPPVATRGPARPCRVVALALCAAAWIRATPSREFFFGGDTLFGLAFAAVLVLVPGRAHVGRAVPSSSGRWSGSAASRTASTSGTGRSSCTSTATAPACPASRSTCCASRVTLVVAVVSVRFVERPVRRSRRSRPALGRSRRPSSRIVIVLVTTAGATSPPGFALATERASVPTVPERRRRRRDQDHWSEGGVPTVPALQGKNITVIGDSRACSLLVGFDAPAPLVGAQVGNGVGARLRRRRRALRRVGPHPGRMARPLPRRVPEGVRAGPRPGQRARVVVGVGGRATCSSATRCSSRGPPSTTRCSAAAWSGGSRRRSRRA